MAHTAAIANYFGAVLFGIIAGSAVNVFGMKFTTLWGLSSTALLLLGLFAYAYFRLIPMWLVGIGAFFLTSGTSAFLAAMGTALVLYPTEAERSRYLTIFFVLSNLGGIVGAALAMGLNWDAQNVDSNSGLSWSSYLALCVVSAGTIILGLGITEVRDTVRSDHSEIVAPTQTLKEEVAGLKAGVRDLNMGFMAPLFLANIWHEVFLYSWVNGKVFNIRSRAINSGLYYLARIAASLLFEWVSNGSGSLLYRVYGCVSLTGGVIIVGTICICFLVFSVGGLTANGMLDISDKLSAPLIIAFIAYGALETIGASLVYWLLGVLPFKDAAAVPRYAGWFRMFSALGAAISWTLDIRTVVPYPWQFFITTMLWVVALLMVLRLSSRLLKEASKVEMSADIASLEVTV
eukprot:Gregarina_sp_Poly_1__7891@NODE_448_length_8319_cov_132_464615_g366_i0_p2_GENE_NODE_448_length_8319_cov_132_464615_g366_i0NODE_448_length_8319_cov_132_464615_g366_i0_p2_ORF_typecomplete_len404_score41_82MFS_1/PF07690_16/2_4e10MFS_1/PF07690_16/3_9e02UNC93/PF05978_16/1_1e08UNC93/PF05978_16/1_2e04MFS_2/PF13347_6/7_5e02MFS_2/PF13347_6/2e05MFS_2/PF13347_6/5_1e02_NODE_448_length_8319_cov_132_464615_g366_i016032814